ncbi:MAG: ABC transporter permease, partial [Eubacterium sp.]|nr:ABC transporter permease [Eubacterium sp.]
MVPWFVFAILFILIPLFLVFSYGFTTPEGKLTWDNVAVIARPEYLRALLLSVGLALISTAICIVIAYPLCLFLIEKSPSKQVTLFILFVIPLAMNTLLS